MRRVLYMSGITFASAVAAVLVAGAVASATDPNRVQGVVEAKVVNDTGARVHIGICANRSCSTLESGSARIDPGETFYQSVGAYDSQPLGVRSAGGLPNRCVRLVTEATVLPSYNLSALPACP
jgi:hypothetical protein